MDTTLHSVGLAVGDLEQSLTISQEVEETEHHIHLPNPSYWPLLLGAAVLVEVTGLLFVPEGPWLSIIAAPFVLLGILGWGLEDPMGHPTGTAKHVHKDRPTRSAQEIVDLANAAVESVVTFGSTAYSTHPIKVEIEEDHGKDGVVLTIYGKVELATQRQEIYAALQSIDGVISIKNFVVAEDEIQDLANQRLANMQAQGKLDGTQNISVLVENYILHIYGDVPNTKMKYALERELIGIPGVRVVVNHIGLNKDIPGNLGKTANK
jgi:BON domain-containing protein